MPSINNLKALEKLLSSGEKVDIEYKRAKNTIPKCVYESYSAFANTSGGLIVLGVEESLEFSTLDKKAFTLSGVDAPEKMIEDFWSTINGNKVNANILIDSDVYCIGDESCRVIVIRVPQADYTKRPVYVGENPFKGTFKRNHEGDYHCSQDEVRAMIRDQNPDGNDGLIIEGYTIEDLDVETLQHYRNLFRIQNPQHVWNTLADLQFLEALGACRTDRRRHIKGVTLAGLLMFGTGSAIKDEFDNLFMDYRDESGATFDIRWTDRVTYDGTWENNVFNFFTKVIVKLTSDLKKPFSLDGIQRIDDTRVHQAVREAFVNMIIHADYLIEGVLKVIKAENGFTFTNPGDLKIPKEVIYQGGTSKPRNPRIQTMFRMVGYGDSAGSGFPTIVSIWKEQGWALPVLIENKVLNQVSLELCVSITPLTTQSTAHSATQSTVRPLKNDEAHVTLSEKDKMLLDYIQKHPLASQRVLAEGLSWEVDTVKYYVRKLVNAGVLQRCGNARSGSWRVVLERATTQSATQSATQSSARSLKNDEARVTLSEKDKMLLNYIQKHPLASQRVLAEGLSWEVDTVKYYVRKLVNTGVLRRNGNSRSGSWQITDLEVTVSRANSN